MGLMYSFTGIVHFSVCLWQCAHEVGCGYVQCVCVCVCVCTVCVCGVRVWFVSTGAS